MVLRSLSRPGSGADEAAHTPRMLVAGFGENPRPQTIRTAGRVRENQYGIYDAAGNPHHDRGVRALELCGCAL
jgi:hypothetical protein